MLSSCLFQTSGVNRDSTLKHDYPANDGAPWAFELEVELSIIQLQYLRAGTPCWNARALFPAPPAWHYPYPLAL